MFDFLKKEEKRDKTKRKIQTILESESKKAKQNEISIGIDPETYLGREILCQSRKLMGLEHEIYDLKKMTAELISCQKEIHS